MITLVSVQYIGVFTWMEAIRIEWSKSVFWYNSCNEKDGFITVCLSLISNEKRCCKKHFCFKQHHYLQSFNYSQSQEPGSKGKEKSTGQE